MISLIAYLRDLSEVQSAYRIHCNPSFEATSTNYIAGETGGLVQQVITTISSVRRATSGLGPNEPK